MQVKIVHIIRNVIMIILNAAFVCCFAAFIFIETLGNTDEIVYINGLKGEYFSHILLGWGIVSAGAAACFWRIRLKKIWTRLVSTVLITIVIIFGTLTVFNTAVNKHRYYMYNDMYNYGSHKIITRRSGEKYVCYQQNGRYTYKEFYSSDTPVTAVDLNWSREGLYIAVGEHIVYDREGDMEIVTDFEYFPYSEYNK